MSFTFCIYFIIAKVSFDFWTIMFASIQLFGMDLSNPFSNILDLQESSFIFSIIEHSDIYLEIIIDVSTAIN